MALKAARFSAAQTGTSIVDAGAAQKIRPRFIHLSVPDAQYATISLGGTVIAAVQSGSLNLPIPDGDAQGAKGGDLTLDSGGAVAYVVVYDLLNR